MLIYDWKKQFSELCQKNKGTIEPTVRSVCSNGLFIQAQQQLRHLSQELAVSQNSPNMEMLKTTTLTVSISTAQSGCEQKTSLIIPCKYEHSLTVICAMKLSDNDVYVPQKIQICLYNLLCNLATNHIMPIDCKNNITWTFSLIGKEETQKSTVPVNRDLSS